MRRGGVGDVGGSDDDRGRRREMVGGGGEKKILYDLILFLGKLYLSFFKIVFGVCYFKSHKQK